MLTLFVKHVAFQHLYARAVNHVCVPHLHVLSMEKKKEVNFFSMPAYTVWSRLAVAERPVCQQCPQSLWSVQRAAHERCKWPTCSPCLRFLSWAMPLPVPFWTTRSSSPTSLGLFPLITCRSECRLWGREVERGYLSVCAFSCSFQWYSMILMYVTSIIMFTRQDMVKTCNVGRVTLLFVAIFYLSCTAILCSFQSLRL